MSEEKAALARLLHGACSFSPVILGVDLSLLWAGGSYDVARGRALASAVHALALGEGDA